MPIKGTRPIGEDVDDAKDAAEHVMIVDLERNDLSRVSEVGSIRWPELMAQHELAGVTHLVSTVEGRARADASLADILRATFPGGSITGAPKIAALDHIARLEPVGRGASMGVLGTFQANGDFELALTIRTFAVAEGRAHLWVGGGIVWDSDPEAEIEESWVKARPLLAAVGGLCVARRMTLLAVAVAGRGLVDPAEPVFRADDDALLRGGAAFETMPRLSAAGRFSLGRPSRRASGSSSPSRSRWPRGTDGDAEELVALVVGAAAPDHRTAAVSDRRGPRRDRCARCRRGSTSCACRGLALQELRSRRPTAAPRRGAKTTSYDVSGFAARRDAERAGRRRRAVSSVTGCVLEAPTVEHLVEARRRALRRRLRGARRVCLA